MISIHSTYFKFLCIAYRDFSCFHFVPEHDDRDRNPSDITIRKPNKGGNRRVSFKTSGIAGPGAKRRENVIKQGMLRAQLEEDDERMVDFDPSKASTFRRRNSPIPGSARNKAKGLVENGSGWFQVTVSESVFEIYRNFQFY